MADCNGDGRPDDCDVAIGFEARSGPMTLVPYVPVTLVVADPPAPSGDVLILVRSTADVHPPTWSLNVSLNGTVIGHVFEGPTPEYPVEPEQDVLRLSAQAFTDMVGDGDAEVEVRSLGLYVATGRRSR